MAEPRQIAWLPLSGALLGLGAAAVLFVVRLVTVPELAALLALATLAAATGGRQLAGLAAMARQPALGAVTVLFAVLLQYTALVVCVRQHRGTESLLLAVLAGRLAVLWAARPGLRLALGWTAAVAAEAFGYGRFDPNTGSLNAGLRGLLALAAALAACWVLRRLAVRRSGGLPGAAQDALGEVAQTVVLVLMSTELPAPLLKPF